MRRTSLAARGALACVGFVMGLAAGIGTITSAIAAPVEAFGQSPALDFVKISPLGDRLVYATGDGPSRMIVVHSFSQPGPALKIPVPGQKLREIAWAGDDHLLITYSTTSHLEGFLGRGEWYQTIIYDVADQTQMDLLGNYPRAANFIASLPQERTVGGKAMVYVTGFYTPGTEVIPTLFSIDIAANKTSIVEGQSKNADGWLVDQSGRPVAESDYDGVTKRWTLRVKKGSAWQEAFSADAPMEAPDIEGLSADGGSVLVDVPGGDGFEQRAYSLTDGSQTGSALPQGVDDVVDDPVTHRVIGMKKDGGDDDYTFFAPEDETRAHQIANAFLGEQMDILSWTDDKSKVVVQVFGPRDGASYELIDLATMTTRAIGPVYRDIGPDDIGEVKHIVYAAADGMKIPAVLTLPKGRDPKNLPLVVLPHGGPAAHDEPGFDWWAQAIASQGYAVLQPEFRGSDGLGWDFLAAGFGQWGRKMQTDLSDGVRYLASNGTIDPKRVCIVGASYGGYAALAGAALDTGVYRCAVSVAGVGDPRNLLRWESSQTRDEDIPEMHYWERFMGTSGLSDPKFDEISPMAHAGAVTIPVLLIHGTDDTVVPIAQSREMRDALKSAGKDVSYVELEDEDHWLSKPETRTQMLTATVAFLVKNNPP